MQDRKKYRRPKCSFARMLSELQRIGSCVVPGEKAKAPAPTSSVHGMQLRCAPVWWKYASTIYGTQRVLVRTSDCGTFDPRTSSNVSFAPKAALGGLEIQLPLYPRRPRALLVPLWVS